MIRIGNPIIENQEGKTTLKAFISNDAEGVNEWLWYSTDDAYGKYFCQEVADAFVLPMILRAVKTHQNIVVESSMSEKLFYNLNDSVFYAVTKAYQKKYGKHHEEIVKVECDNLVSNVFTPTAVGTGCSLGVDSFAVLKHHFLSEDCPRSYKITHIALFNAGAYGHIDVEGARHSFERERDKTKMFADSLGLPFVWVDSNVRSFFPEGSFDWCHTYLNMGIVLSMQKLWKKYLYASSVSIDYFEFSVDFCGHYEPYLLPHLSTEVTELVPASMNMRRSDKVKYISTEKIVQENLNVCLKEQSANTPGIERYQGNYLNCGRCQKCLRTMLQLDILGVLNDFSKIIDLEEWPKLKDRYIAEVIVNKSDSLMLKDLHESMLEHDYLIPEASKTYVKCMTSKRYAKRMRWKRRFHRILNRLKK